MYQWTNKCNEYKNNKCRNERIESSLDKKWSINKRFFTPDKLYNLYFFLLKKYRIPYYCIDNHGNRKYKKSDESIYSILECMKKSYYKGYSRKLTLIIKKLSIHGILIVVKHLCLSRDSLIECCILIKWNIIDPKRIWKRIFSSIFDKTRKIWIARFEKIECICFCDILDDDSWETYSQIIDEYLCFDIITRISTLIIDGKWDPIIHGLDKLPWSKEYKKKYIHEEYQECNHKNRWDRKKWIPDNIFDGVFEDAHNFGSSRR